MSRDRVKITAEDVLIVLRPDGTYEFSFPNLDSPTDPVPDHIHTAASLAYALNTPSLCDLLEAHFSDYAQKLGNKKVS